jgi:Heterodisulfide reductase, subunit C
MLPEILSPDYQFLEALEREGPFKAEACFQCRKCTNGCPVAFAMDLFPDEVIRMVILGQREKVLSCRTIWICAACETCTTRCPNEVRIAELMDHLKEMAIRENISCPEPQVLSFHETFLKNIEKRGRIFESTLLPAYLLRSGQFQRKWKDGTWPAELGLGWELFSKGRMPLWPTKNKGYKEIRRIFTGNKQKKTS